MGLDLPFELDTIDAITEAKGGKRCVSILIRVLPFVLHLACAVLEYLAFTTLKERFSIVCLVHYEISDPVDLFMMLDYSCVLPDALFAILGPMSVFMIYNNPYGVFYNLTTGFVNIANCALFLMRYKFCGNVEQGLIPHVPFMACASGVLHISNAVIAHISFMSLDKEGELYFGRVGDCIDDMKHHK